MEARPLVDDGDHPLPEEPLPGFVRPAPPKGFVRAAPEPPRRDDGAEIAAMYEDLVKKPPAPAPAMVGPARTATCAVCGATYDPLSRESHEASIGHTLALGFEARGRRVLISDGNLGARLLAKAGWEDDGVRPGLGAPGREGRIQPIATALKRDTAGLGAVAYERRVSHFKPGDATAVGRAPARARAPPPRPGAKRESKRRTEAEDRQRSVRLRREFSDRIPEGFEELFE